MNISTLKNLLGMAESTKTCNATPSVWKPKSRDEQHLLEAIMAFNRLLWKLAFEPFSGIGQTEIYRAISSDQSHT